MVSSHANISQIDGIYLDRIHIAAIEYLGSFNEILRYI